MFAPQQPKIFQQVVFGIVFLALGLGIAFLLRNSDFFRKDMKALYLGSDQVVYYPFVSQFETGLDTSRLLLGPGFMEGLSRDLGENAGRFQRCRQFFLPSAQMARFRVTVVPETRKLQVRSLMEGADSNGPHASCLRDALEDLSLPSLSQVPKVEESRYKLVVDVQARVSAPVPRETP